jgi:hypothetical protein
MTLSNVKSQREREAKSVTDLPLYLGVLKHRASLTIAKQNNLGWIFAYVVEF